VWLGVPWGLATTNLWLDTAAGLSHFAALLWVPWAVALVLEALRTRVAGVPREVGKGAVGIGFGVVVGIAGYLFGGETYRVDPYVGIAFSVLLALGIGCSLRIVGGRSVQ
jgi:hypothetical protein